MSTPLTTNTQKLFGTDVIQTHNLISVGFSRSFACTNCWRRINAIKFVNTSNSIFCSVACSRFILCRSLPYGDKNPHE